MIVRLRCYLVILAVALSVISTRLGVIADDLPKGYSEEIPGTKFKLEMVPVPAGTFMMGSPTAEAGRAEDEGPQHQVGIKAFWMLKTEVPWELYDLFWKDESLPQWAKPPSQQYGADAVTRPTNHYSDETFGHAREGNPVLGISHHSAMMFCRWLSKKTGKLYRLPTEAEWEYACRAGSKTAYSFGDDVKSLGDFAWYAANSAETTHPVGSKKPNAWGLHDMMGNVAEWCLDHYTAKDYFAYPTDKLTLQPVRKPTPVKFSHVMRGGSWADDAPRLRSAARRGSDQSLLKRDPQRPQSIWWLTEGDFIGFRFVRPVVEQDDLKNLMPPVTWESKNTKD